MMAFRQEARRPSKGGLSKVMRTGLLAAVMAVAAVGLGGCYVAPYGYGPYGGYGYPRYAYTPYRYGPYYGGGGGYYHWWR